MRALGPAPVSVVDPASREPRYGSYRGGVDYVDLRPLAGPLRRVTNEKRWMYASVASDEAYVALAIVRLGYAATCFAYAFDARSHRMLATRSVVAPAAFAHVGDRAGDGCLARFEFAGASARIERPRGANSYDVQARLQGLVLRARLDARRAPPSITAIAPIGTEGSGLANVTEKRALLDATGEIAVEGRSLGLDGGLAGYDYTHGLLARRTVWRWAWGLGRATTGERVGFNLVQGFVGEPECAAWIDGELAPLREGRFAFDRDSPLSEWRVTTADGAVDLTFTPGGMHSEEKNLGIVASSFVQPCGVFNGTLRAAGKTLVIEKMLGVTEDQSVVW